MKRNKSVLCLGEDLFSRCMCVAQYVYRIIFEILINIINHRVQHQKLTLLYLIAQIICIESALSNYFLKYYQQTVSFQEMLNICFFYTLPNWLTK